MADLSAVAAVRDQIDTLRATIAREKRALAELRDAPLNARDAAAVLEDYIARRAGDYEQLGTAHSFTLPAPGAGTLLPPGADPEAMLCFFLGERIRQRFAGHFAGICPPSLDRSARRPLVREAEARLLELEREEEDLISEALAAGVSVVRRPDADPRAVLNDDDEG